MTANVGGIYAVFTCLFYTLESYIATYTPTNWTLADTTSFEFLTQSYCTTSCADTSSSTINHKSPTKPTYSEVVRLAETIEIPDDYFDKMSYLDRERAKDIERALRIGASTDDEFIESKMFFKMQKAYQILEPKTEGEIFIENFLNRGLEGIKPEEEYEINYTNKINIRGQVVDVSGWSKNQILTFLKPLDVNEANELYYTEHVHSLFHTSTPTVKLYYPEPYIASPTRIHSDLWILHIFHYQFWLWFFFIFLIVFFFLVFISSVRWNQNQNRPRRETRGVSRSKCGDLITACVPVSWAASIIISESTDATDLHDGFSTGEFVVGVRAYQWGWEYYYPKTIDLNYNVRPSYASFVGNSVKYSTTSDVNNDANHFWRHYQKRSLESVVTPAHLLVLPLDNKNVANFLNFQDIGANTLKQSAAFSKIRANSKLFNTNVVTNASQFALKYNTINALAFNDINFSETNNYGNVRQHNLTAAASSANNLSTFLNETEMMDFLNTRNTTKVTNSTNFERLNDILNSEYFLNTSKYIHNLNMFTNQIAIINDSSDVKHKAHVANLLNSTQFYENNLISQTSILGKNSLLPSSLLKQLTQLDLFNKNITTVKTLLKGENTGVLAADQSVRNYKNLTLSDSSYNLSSYNNALSALNSSDSTSTSFKTSLPMNSQLIDSQSFSKLWTRRLSFGYPHPITYSNNPFMNIFNYDTNETITNLIKWKKNKSQLDTIVTKTPKNLVLKGDQSNAAANLMSAYWRMFWSNTDVSNRLSTISEVNKLENNFYLPLFTNYYDYDFRNAQAMELLEDAFWESSYSSYNFYDYMNLSRDYLKTQPVTKVENVFNQNYFNNNLNLSATTKLLVNPNYKDVSLTGNFYTNSIEMDDFVTQPSLTLLKNFTLFPTTELYTSFDESVTSYKTLQQLTNQILGVALPIRNNFFTPVSFVSVLNNFSDTNYLRNFIYSENALNDFSNESIQNDTTLKNLQFSRPISLRTKAINYMVTYNALQKVFRSRFDEGRSHTSLQLFAQMHLPQPFIKDVMNPTTNLLSKDSNSFYQNFFYKNNNFKIFNTDYKSHINQNYYFYDLPFLLSEGSDSQKFMWFDWWAQWGMYEVQPSSVAKYSTLGVPYSRKHFDFSIKQGDSIQDAETYFLRITRLRKNYLPNWLYSPILIDRLLGSNALLFKNLNNVIEIKMLLKDMYWYHQTLTYKDRTLFKFSPSISGNSIYNKTSWRPFTGVQAYFAKNSQLVDILTRREYLYRKYLQLNKRVINLPSMLTANKNNELIDEVKSSFLLIDPISYSSDISRDFFYSSLPFFKFLLFKTVINDLNTTLQYLPFNATLLNEYLFFYAFNTNSSKIGVNELLYKDQHRPLKKSITSMLRLHGTGAIAMPVDVRLQILASSRDVIHSWAIPSAGIKIDCVPGYTSHRIMTFTLTGIYWGQCMEICGRYHHWMPIIIYFMKRDLFFLWCTHFVFKSSKVPSWKITDKQYSNYIRLISYDKASWLNELSRQL